MAENSDATSNNNVKESKNADDSTQELLKNVPVVVLKLQNEQKKFNEEILRKMRSAEAKIDELSNEQQKLMVANNGMQTKIDKLWEVQQKISTSNSEQSGDTDEIAENEPVVTSIDNGTSLAASPLSSNNIVTPFVIMPASGKSFVLKHVFKNVLEMEEGGELFSEEEERFGVPWRMQITREEEYLGFYLLCSKSCETGNWSIDTKWEQRTFSAIGGENLSFESSKTYESEGAYSGWGTDEFMEWEKLRDYIKDGSLSVEIHVEINKMAGIYKENLRNFDESMEKHSDVVLIVKDTKFYVSKLYLSTHSPYFDSLFFGHFQESKRSEIILTGIDADDFQNYLEVLYCEDPIDETTVEGILLVADMYDTPIVIKKCQKFLIEKSGKTLKKKFLMSARYSLEQLKKKCISGIKSTGDIKAILPDDIEDMDHSIMAELLKKSIEFQ